MTQPVQLSLASCHHPSSWMIFLIMVLNSLRSISPLPSKSISSMISAQNFSSSESNYTSLLPVRVAFTSCMLIEPVLSLSNSWKASLSRSGASKLFFFIDATIHSVNSISPLPSKSTSSKMASTIAASSPTAWKPYCSSSRVILPELLVLIYLKAFSSS